MENKRIAQAVAKFVKADAAAKVVSIDAALAEVEGRVKVALELGLQDNATEAQSICAARFPEKTDGAKRSQMLLVIVTASNYEKLAKVAKAAHVEAQAAGSKSSRVAGKYLSAAKLTRDTGKVPTAEQVNAEGGKSDRPETTAQARCEKRYKELLKFAAEEGVEVIGTLQFKGAANLDALKSMLAGMTPAERAALLKG